MIVADQLIFSSLFNIADSSYDGSEQQVFNEWGMAVKINGYWSAYVSPSGMTGW